MGFLAQGRLQGAHGPERQGGAGLSLETGPGGYQGLCHRRDMVRVKIRHSRQGPQMTTVLSKLTAEQFHEKAGAWLAQKEAENNLSLGVIFGILQRPQAQRAEHHVWIVEEGG